MVDNRIRGINQSEFPILHKIILKLLNDFNLEKIRVIIWPWGLNAFAISLFGDFLIITKGTLEKMNEFELEAIIAHEFSHLFNRDSQIHSIVYIIFILPILYLYLTLNPKNLSEIDAILIIVALLIFIYGFKVRNWISIKIETQADMEAVLKTEKPRELQNALIKLYSGSVNNGTRPNIFNNILDSFRLLIGYFFGFTHPHIKERIEYLEFAQILVDFQKNQKYSQLNNPQDLE